MIVALFIVVYLAGMAVGALAVSTPASRGRQARPAPLRPERELGWVLAAARERRAAEPPPPAPRVWVAPAGRPTPGPLERLQRWDWGVPTYSTTTRMEAISA